jgi:hypothetical protein
MRLHYVAQVDEVVGGTELGESDILYCSVDFSSIFLSSSSVRSQRKIGSVVGRIFPVIRVEVV